MTQPEISINYHLMRVDTAIKKIKQEYEDCTINDRNLIKDYLKKQLKDLLEL